METLMSNDDNQTFIKGVPDNLKAFLKTAPDDNTDACQIYAEYMSKIIVQLPNPEKLQLLTGTSSTQASFYFMNGQGALNASLYNNFLDQRIKGQGSGYYNVKQADTTSDSFVNCYLDLYLKLRYQLSDADKIKQEDINNAVSSTVSELIPIWNHYVETFKPEKILRLSEIKEIALIQVTDSLNTVWIDPDFVGKVKNKPSYPYEHISEFRNIYSKIPKTVPSEMMDLMVNIFQLSGTAGEVTAELANAAHTIIMIIYNLQHPSRANKGIPLTGSGYLIPGYWFERDSDDIIRQLNEYPVRSYTNNNQVFKMSSDVLRISLLESEDLTISPLKFLSNILEDGEQSSVFKETFSGTSCVVEAIVNNPVVEPQMRGNPVPFDIMANTGWMFAEPVKDAIKNGYPPPTNVTGYVFNSEVKFDFEEGGDFGYINSMVFSQFLELYITFRDCNVPKVKDYFEKNKASKFAFLGESIGNPSVVTSYSCQFGNETRESLEVIIKPPPPGYIPPEVYDITHSSSQLIAVEVVYPFAD